eukprot:3221504-Prymnesium_polylepis.2
MLSRTKKFCVFSGNVGCCWIVRRKSRVSCSPLRCSRSCDSSMSVIIVTRGTRPAAVRSFHIAHLSSGSAPLCTIRSITFLIWVAGISLMPIARFVIGER